MKGWIQEMDEVFSGLTLAFLRLERSGKCCHGVSLSQCHTLALLSKNGELAMNELSRQMGLAKSTMTRIVKNMVREGWIEQVRDEEDGRVVHVRLTRKGKGMAQKLDGSSQGYVKRIFRHIPPKSIPRMVESLKWMIKAIETEVQKEDVV